MKINMSKSAVRGAVKVIDDNWRLNAEYEDDELKMWTEYDLIAILKDLLTANKHRDRNGLMDIRQETADWLSDLSEFMSGDGEKLQMADISDWLKDEDDRPGWRLSDITTQALAKSLQIDIYAADLNLI